MLGGGEEGGLLGDEASNASKDEDGGGEKPAKDDLHALEVKEHDEEDGHAENAGEDDDGVEEGPSDLHPRGVTLALLVHQEANKDGQGNNDAMAGKEKREERNET